MIILQNSLDFFVLRSQILFLFFDLALHMYIQLTKSVVVVDGDYAFYF